MVEKTPFKVDVHQKTIPGTPPGARQPRGTWQLVRECAADNRNVSLRMQEETEFRTRVATMKRAARGRRSDTGPSALGGAEGFASHVAAPPLSKTVVVSDDGLKTCVSVAAEARAMASMTAAAEMQCDRYVT